MSGNQSNITTAADLSELVVEDMCVQVMQMRNNRGLNISLLPMSLLVSTTDWFEANRILASVLQSDTANNNINVLRATSAIPKGAVVNHYFTSSTAFFMRTNVKNGLTHFTRDRMTFDQDNDFDTKNAKAAFYERYSGYWSDWRGIVGNAGA